MSLSELVQSDARAIPALDGDRVTLTAPASLGSTVYADLPCIATRAGKKIEAEGFAVVAEAVEVSVALGELAARGLANPEALKAKGWTATLGGIAYNLEAAPIDYTLGTVDITLKRSAA